jgi:hypothetical protein
LAIILHFTAKIKWSLSFSVCFWGLGDFEPCFFKQWRHGNGSKLKYCIYYIL